MASTKLYYANQYFTTTLSVVGGIDDSQTTGIVLSGVSGLDISKPGIALIGYASPLDTSAAEWITYTSINGSNELQGVTRGTEGFSAKAFSNGSAIAFPVSESHINNLNAMFNTTGIDIAQISTPASPDASRNKLYFKSDGELYKLNSSGTETQIGSPTLDKCRVRLASDVTLTASTPTKITFSTEDYDTGGRFASNKFTVATAGYYRIFAQVHFYNGSTTTANFTTYIYKNGAAVSSSNIAGNALIGNSCAVSDTLYLAVNDYIECFATAPAANWLAYAEATLTHMNIEQITAG